MTYQERVAVREIERKQRMAEQARAAKPDKAAPTPEKKG